MTHHDLGVSHIDLTIILETHRLPSPTTSRQVSSTLVLPDAAPTGSQ